MAGALAYALLSAATMATAGELAMLFRQQLSAAGAADQQSAPVAPKPAPGSQGQLRLPTSVWNRPVPDITRIGLERTECFGTCPAYTVVIMADGSFTYTGEAHVERMGDHRGTVPLWLLNQVFRYVEDSGFMALANRFDVGALDVPSTYTMVEWAGVTHVVLDVGNVAPATVWAFGMLIDQMLELATWE